MVGGLVLGHRGVLAGLLGPVKLSRVYDDTPHGVSVAADVLGEGFDDNVRAVLDGAAQVGGCQRVVHYKGDVDLVGEAGEGGDVGDDTPRVAERLNEQGLDFGLREGGLDSRRVRDVDEVALPAKLLDGPRELRHRASVELVRGDDLVSRRAERVENHHLGRVAARGASGGDASLQVGDLGLQLRNGWVGEARIDVASLL
mmetsp:Transcript_1967/g.4954  ORF Transcript_1967/g.4954 Transcript_1967/m.4954 type:complete len:200 (+) Transcript_1967:856-1455(+)